MARTAKSLSVRRDDRRKRPSWRKRSAWLVVLVLLAALVWYWSAIMAQAQAGAAYGARIGCSCRFVAGRPLEDCHKDFLSGMALVRLSEDVDAKSVTGRVFPLSAETVSYRKGEGCVFDKAE